MARLSEEEWSRIRHKIKNEGLSVADAAKIYGVHANTIYKNLEKAGTPGADLQKMKRLEKENEDLKIILAEAMLLINREKKAN